LLALVLTDEQWLKYSMSQMLQMAQVFVSKSGSNIGCHVAQIFIDIHKKSDTAIRRREKVGAGCSGLQLWKIRRKRGNA
ncbi:MAG: hypothetical protein SOV03_07340, partial [Faecalibacterium sp.]|nr:hypothetical protein [Faecalibacterium sp.]